MFGPAIWFKNLTAKQLWSVSYINAWCRVIVLQFFTVLWSWKSCSIISIPQTCSFV